MTGLVGRDSELAEIGGLLERARSGLSGVLVVRGEPGIGKTCLLDAVASSAAGFDVVRLVGIESEMRLGYAALHQLLTPFLDGVDLLPPPQARALKAAFGMSDDAAPDLFFVGLGALTLISAASTRQPLLVIVDDGQWLDQDSADALGLLARRLHADRVCLLVSMRDSFDDHRLFDGLRPLALAPLSEAASVELLEAAVRVPVADDVRDRVLADARGNPLALVEFGRQLSPEQLVGAAQLPPALPVDRRLEGHFLRQVGALPPATQRLLLVVAAEPTGDTISILGAGRELDFDETAIGPAQVAGLVRSGPRILFRHPLIRSAVYQGATPADRCRAHAALAAVTDADRDADRRAWHRAAATQFPDDDVAAELERAAQHAGSRGSSSASAALLARAAELTLDNQQRAIRLFGAAAAELTAGNTVRAQANLARARPDLHDPLHAASARRLEGAIAFVGSDGGNGDSVSMMIEAARALEPVDVHLARDAILDILPMAIYFGESSSVPVVDVARLARSFELPAGTEPTAVDLMLDAISAQFTEGYRSAAPLLRRALAAVQAAPEIRGVPRHLARACYLPQALSDDDALLALATACATTSREQGSFQYLNEGLSYLYLHQLRVGSLDAAEDFVTEEHELQSALGHLSRGAEARELVVSAWRGRAADVRVKAAELQARAQELGFVVRLTAHALIVLEVGLGNYQVASSLDRGDFDRDLALGALRAADAVEAHVRSGNRAPARAAVAHLEERATANESLLDLGLLARSEALLADDVRAEAHFRESIGKLEACGARLHLARSELVYGEWLRRQKRRRDAREQLGAAHDIFESMGADGFAERARVELLATGARARKRVDETRHDLTPQESQIARLAAAGLTNPEVAERLFISTSTVDYHLRKVYRKLDITSRHQLGSVLADT